MNPDTKLLASLGLAGALIGLGQLLASGDKITLRVVLARSILSGALGLSVAAASLLFPTLGYATSVGLACVIASLGTSALERLFQRFLGGANGGQ